MKENNLFPEYAVKVKENFANNPLVNFIHALRNYNLHESVPLIEVIAKQNEEGYKVGNYFYVTLCIIPTRALPIKSSYWNIQAKEFIKNSGAVIDIFKTVIEYWTVVTDFQNWFQKKQEAIHDEEIKRYLQYAKEYVKLRLEFNIDKSTYGTVGKRATEIALFGSVLNVEEMNQLQKIPQIDNARVNKAIEMIEKKLNLSEEAKEKIINLYHQPAFYFYKEVGVE